MNNAVNSRSIPSEIKREVRKRCGFGCIICGLPLYEYEHMEGWAKVKRHIANEITLLCDRHHREKTNGLLSIDTVKEANQNPINLQRGVSEPYNLHYNGNFVEVDICTNIFTSQSIGQDKYLNVLSVDKESILGVKLSDEYLLLNLILYDECNFPYLIIVDNELIYNINPWDIELKGRRLIIRERKRNFLIEIEFNPPNKVKFSKGKFLCNGVEIKLDDDKITLLGKMSIYGNQCENVDNGIVLGCPPPLNGSCLFQYNHIRRYPEKSNVILPQNY